MDNSNDCDGDYRNLILYRKGLCMYKFLFFCRLFIKMLKTY